MYARGNANQARLVVQVHHATGLKNTQTLGTQDPYALIRLGAKSLKTAVHEDGGMNPVWNYKGAFQYNNEPSLNVEVWNSNVLSDAFIGSFVLSLSSVPRNFGSPQMFRLTAKNNRSAAGQIYMTCYILEVGHAAAQGSALLRQNFAPPQPFGQPTYGAPPLPTSAYPNMVPRAYPNTAPPAYPNMATPTYGRSPSFYPQPQNRGLANAMAARSSQVSQPSLRGAGVGVVAANTFMSGNQYIANAPVAQSQFPVAQHNQAAGQIPTVHANVQNIRQIHSAPLPPRPGPPPSRPRAEPEAAALDPTNIHFTPEARAQLRGVVGDLTDERANSLLDQAGGDVQRAVNYFFRQQAEEQATRQAKQAEEQAARQAELDRSASLQAEQVSSTIGRHPSCDDYPEETVALLRTIVGDVSDDRAALLLDQADGDVGRAANYFFSGNDSAAASTAVSASSTRRLSLLAADAIATKTTGGAYDQQAAAFGKPAASNQRTMEVKMVPPMKPGMKLKLRDGPDGKQFEYIIPQYALPGMTLKIPVPDPDPTTIEVKIVPAMKPLMKVKLSSNGVKPFYYTIPPSAKVGDVLHVPIPGVKQSQEKGRVNAMNQLAATAVPIPSAPPAATAAPIPSAPAPYSAPPPYQSNPAYSWSHK
jgi:hypothetical protein